MQGYEIMASIHYGRSFGRMDAYEMGLVCCLLRWWELGRQLKYKIWAF